MKITDKVKDISLLVLSILVILFGFLYFNRVDDEMVVEVPVKIEVPVPIVEKQFDTIYEPYPVYVKPDTVKVVEYRNSDIQTKDSLYVVATAKRKYTNVYEDEYLVATVNSETSGFLNKETFGYKTKPRSIAVDTVVPVTIDVPYRSRIFIGGEVSAPVLTGVLTQDLIRQSARAEIGAGIDTKNYIFKGSLATDGFVGLGVYYKF